MIMNHVASAGNSDICKHFIEGVFKLVFMILIFVVMLLCFIMQSIVKTASGLAFIVAENQYTSDLDGSIPVLVNSVCYSSVHWQRCTVSVHYQLYQQDLVFVVRVIGWRLLKK